MSSTDWKFGDVLWPKIRNGKGIMVMFIGHSDEVAGAHADKTLFRATVLFDDHHYVKSGDADGRWEVDLWESVDASD